MEAVPQPRLSSLMSLGCVQLTVKITKTASLHGVNKYLFISPEAQCHMTSGKSLGRVLFQAEKQTPFLHLFTSSPPLTLCSQLARKQIMPWVQSQEWHPTLESSWCAPCSSPSSWEGLACTQGHTCTHPQLQPLSHMGTGCFFPLSESAPIYPLCCPLPGRVSGAM